MSLKMDTVTQVQILHDSICILLGELITFGEV